MYELPDNFASEAASSTRFFKETGTRRPLHLAQPLPWLLVAAQGPFRRCVRELKRRQPFVALEKARGTRNEAQGNDAKPGRTASGGAAPGLTRQETAQEIKKALGGRRNPLIRLDSAKEIKGFSLLDFVRALLDEALTWLDLDLAWVDSR